jgi:alkylation response protein AidB-like acyl-CoA dehydrogenase
MDFELKFSPEIEAFRKEVSDWMDANVPALQHSSDPRDYDRDDWDRRIAFRKALGAKGWLYPTSNPKYGGGGLSVEHSVVLHQELEKRNVFGLQELGGRVIAACTQAWGTEEQKNYWVPKMMTGEADSWQLLTEPQGGSDLASAKTTAILDGDDYVINGQKIFVGSERVAEYGFAIVNSDPAGARHRNLTYLIVPLDAPGVIIQPLYLLSSATGPEMPNLHKNIVFFDDVRVPVFNRIGGHNEGWKVASTNMELEHGGAGNIGNDRMLDRLIEVLHEIKWEGKPLIQDPDIRDLLGEVLQERETRRLFGLRNYWLANTHQRREHEGPQLSYWGKTRAHFFVQRVQDMLGHYALAHDPKYAVARGFLELIQRSVFVAVHAGGGLNIQATIVARRLGIGRNAREEAAPLD